jgi:CRP-like cAMP-binding protein
VSTADLPAGLIRLENAMRKHAPAEVIERLSAIPLFDGCGGRDLEDVARLGALVQRAGGTDLMHQGWTGSEFFVLMDGRARCVVDGHEVQRFGPGDFFGELALLDGAPRAATVVTDGDAQVLVLDRREFCRLLDITPVIARNMLVELARRLRATSRQVLDVRDVRPDGVRVPSMSEARSSTR